MTAADSFVQAVQVLPLRLRGEALSLPEGDRARTEELRLRTGWPMTALIAGAERPLGGPPVEGGELDQLVEIASRASRHAVLDQIRRGYLTIEGGHRIGLCGTAVMREGEIHALRALSSADLRLARQVEGAGKSPRRAAPPPPKAKPAKEKKPKTKPAGVMLRIFGAVALFVGVCIAGDFMSEALQGYGVDLDDFFAALSFLGAGGIMFFRGRYLNKMSRRSQRYILAIGNTDAMPIDEIAKRVNRKPAQAEKELQKLIDKGYLGEDAYIDYERGYFLRFGATLEEEEPAVREAPVQPTPKEVQEGYSGILRNIRHANDRIADPVLSRKIDRLEQVSAQIFKEVEEHPAKRNSIHTFFDYYLPTTQKLLDTYADFEETGVEGENLREAKERIEQTMDLIVAGFEHQLDQLYSSDAMDVASDIKVMEAMLKRDTASVAKDFGYPEPPKLTLDPEKDRRDQGGQTQTM